MPFYNWKCEKCEEIWEYYQTMTERDESPPTKCSDCGGDLYQVHDPGAMPKFKVGDGAYYPNKLQ